MTSTPLPGPRSMAAVRPKLTATPVVNRYSAMVLPAIDPMRLLAPSELIPQISDTITRGTTRSLSDAMKIRPKTSKNPRIRPFWINPYNPDSGSITPISHSSAEPRVMPASIARRMRLVSDILFLAGFGMPGRDGHIGAGVTGRGVGIETAIAAPTTYRVINHRADSRSLALAGLPTLPHSNTAVPRRRRCGAACQPYKQE